MASPELLRPRNYSELLRDEPGAFHELTLASGRDDISFLVRGARLRSQPDLAATGAGIDRLPSRQPGPPGTGGLGDLMAMVVGSQVC